MFTDIQIDKLENKLDDEDIIYTWEATSPAIGGRYGSLIRLGMVIIPLLVVMVPFFILCIKNQAYYMMGGLVCVSMFFVYLTYFLQYANNYHEYKLTRIGIIETSKQIIPKGVYTFFRGFAWFGIAICIIAVILVGPLALVGAGAFGLMSFGMTSLSPKIEVDKHIFSDKMIFSNIKENNCIYLFSIPIKDSLSFPLYYEDNYNSVFSNLKNNINIDKYIEVRSLKKLFENELYTSTEIYDENN